MATKLFVGGLAWATTEDGLRQLFSQAGQVVSAQVITDRMSGRSRGFGFVEMTSEEEAQAAVKQFNGFELDGRKLIVNEAKPRPEGGNDRPRRDFQGGGGRGGGFQSDRRPGGFRGGFGGNNRGSFRRTGHR